jgi:hypothetical protein
MNFGSVSLSRGVCAVALLVCAACGPAPAQPLVIESTIALPDTSGRIDHLSIDLRRKRLFVAELGNDTVDAVDLVGRKVLHRIAGFDEPQGVVYVPKTDLIAVACGGDGTVRMLSGAEFAARGSVRLSGDADNIHLDPRNDHVVVGYGDGALAVIDPAKATKIGDIKLPAHPEGFAISNSGIAYVNIPDARQIDAVDLDTGKVKDAWATPHVASNFPLAIIDKSTIAIVFRAPPKLLLRDTASGRVLAEAQACGDADDVFFDAKRARIYLSCGTGDIDVLTWSTGRLQHTARIPTSWGARTSLFVPELDRLFVAERAGLLASNAAIQAYRPAP